MKTNNPITIDGITYNEYAANLSTSSIISNDRVIVNVALRLTPFHRDSDGKITPLKGYDKTVYIADIEKTLDKDNIITFGSMYKSLEEYVLKKNI